MVFIDPYFFEPIEGKQGDESTRQASRIKVTKGGYEFILKEINVIKSLLERGFPSSEYDLIIPKENEIKPEDDEIEVWIYYSLKKKEHGQWRFVPKDEIIRQLLLIKSLT